MSRARLLIALSFLSILGRAAFAHIPDNYQSVHFNNGNPDFGAVPRRAFLPRRGENTVRHLRDGWGMGGWEPEVPYSRYGEELSGGRDAAWERRREAARGALRVRVDAALAAERWAEARRLLTAIGDRYGWTGGLRDRVEALAGAVNVPAPMLRAYLRAMDDLEGSGDRWNAAQATFERIRGDRNAGPLRDHAAYQLASLAAQWYDYPRAVRLYRAFLNEFPRSPKREAALIMAARCGILPATAEGRNLPEATAALDVLKREFPQSRFQRAALGLRARVDFLAGRYGDAAHVYLKLGDLASAEMCARQLPRVQKDRLRPRLLAAYLRRLERVGTYDGYEHAVSDVDRSMQAITPAGARVFVGMLMGEPRLAAPYFYYRLYHCDNKPKDLTNLARLADRVGRGVRLPPEVSVRLAEVHYQNGAYASALRWVGRVEQGHVGPYDRALFVKGASLHKRRRYAAARAAFADLLARCPDSPLRHGAREEYALLLEQAGDLAGALDQYFALRYDQDVAFLLDGKMTPEQIADLLRARPNHPRRDLIAYSLGLRYLRQERWAEARRWLESVPKAEYRRFNAFSDSWEMVRLEPTGTDPLRAVGELAALQERIRRAGGRAAKASAIYRYGRYYYRANELLLYNAALWNRRRMMSFDFWWNQGANTAADHAAARRHNYEHEAYAHALRAFEQVADEYPDTPSAPYALYSAACAAQHLSDFNEWWRDEDARHGLSRRASRRMAALARRYPKHPLAGHARKYARVFAEQHADRLKLWKEERAEEAKRAAEAVTGRG